MKFISSEQFLRQPEEVQKVFRNWFKENVQAYDLYKITHSWSEIICLIDNPEYIQAVKDCIDTTIPLLTEGQLRKFIEDKTNGCIGSKYTDAGYIIYIWDSETPCYITHEDEDMFYTFFKTKEINLLQAYWQAACKIAMKETRHAVQK